MADARVLTFVFYHCRGAGGVQEQRFALDFYGYFTLQVGYWTVGIGDLEAEAYAESENPMAWALASWMRQKRRERVELRLRLMQKTLRSVPNEGYRWLLLNTLRSYFRLNEVETMKERQLIESQAYPDVEEYMETEFDRLEYAHTRKALQDALWKVVSTRFPSASPGVEAAIRRLEDLNVLDALIGEAARATSLEEILPTLNP